MISAWDYDGIAIVNGERESPEDVYINWIFAPDDSWVYKHKKGDAHISTRYLTKIGEAHLDK